MRRSVIRNLCWLLVVFVVALSFLQTGWVARAGPPHIVTGGVPGPGANPADPTPANPANEANATFYLVDKPAEPIVRDPQLDPADGVVPASFVADVGSVWNWDPLNPNDDQVVVVVEAIRGLNGWAGINYTSSANGTLSAAAGVQDLGNAPLEAIPATSYRTGVDYVNVTWTGLTASNRNVVSYTVYRASGPAGPWTAIGRSGSQVSGGAMWFNNTPVSAGSYCYGIAADYRRDLAGAIYTTVGRSETRCATAGTPPARPVVVVTAPSIGTILTGGQATTVTFTLSPPPVAQLRVWVNYTSSAGNGAIVTDQTGFSSPANVPWTTPTINAVDARIHVDAINTAGLKGSNQSAVFAIDSTAPTVMNTVPANMEASVLLNQVIRITFSERMDRAATQAAFSITPVVTIAASDFGWGAGDTILSVAHPSQDFQPRTQYAATVSVGAKDVSSPGNAMAAPRVWTFTTGDLTPTAPGNLRSSGIGPDRVTLAWDPPTVYTTGRSIPTTAVITYKVYRSTTSGGAGTQVGGILTAATFTDTGLSGSTTYYYTVVAVADNVESARSTELRVTTGPQSAPDLTWLWVLLVIIIAVILVIALLAMRRRRKPEAMAQPSTPAEEPPVPAEDSGETL